MRYELWQSSYIFRAPRPERLRYIVLYLSNAFPFGVVLRAANLQCQ